MTAKIHLAANKHLSEAPVVLVFEADLHDCVTLKRQIYSYGISCRCDVRCL